MGYPVTNLNDMKYRIEQEYLHPNFFVMVLYRNEDDTFKREFRSNFDKYSKLSGHQIHFFVFDRFDFFNTATINAPIDNKAIELISSKYDIDYTDLPVVVLFNDLHANSYTTISLKSIHNSPKEIDSFFTYLLTPINTVVKGRGLENAFKTSRIEELLGPQVILNDFHSVNARQYESYYRELENVTMKSMLLNFLSEYHHLMNEIKKALAVVCQRQELLENKKRENRMKNAGKHGDISLDTGYSEIVNLMYDVSKKILFDLKLLNGNKDNTKYDDIIIPDIFEEESKNMIKTSLELSKYLEVFNNPSVDYTPFVSGYWKAIEN